MSEFREIPFGSECYEQECRLRNELLREPLGLSLWDENLSEESGQIHFGIFDGEMLEACVVVQPLDERMAKLRQVAVRGVSQRKGLGTELMKTLEEDLRERGFCQLILHSRSSVCGFYQKQGYEVEGDAFQEIGLAHFRMKKLLH